VSHMNEISAVLSSILRNTVHLLLGRPLVYLILCVSLFFAVSLLSAQSPTPQPVSLDDALHQLADRIASMPNLHGPFRLEILEDSSLAAETGKDWQDVFRKELESRHINLTEDPAAALLRIGVAETPTEIVLSAGVRLADRDEVRLVTFPRATFRLASLPVAPVRLEKQLVYQSTDRLLDASSLWNGASTGMVLLAVRNGELAVLRIDASGALQQSVPLTVAGPLLSRDPRAELTAQADAVSVLLPGRTCQFTWAASGDAKCHSVKSTWRAATVLTPSCDAGGWKLLADGSDWTTPDLLQAVPENSMQKGSASILSDFPGPIISTNGEQNPSSALAVTRNLRTGNYEVYKITLACGN
jgi:hypothetical protein